MFTSREAVTKPVSWAIHLGKGVREFAWQTRNTCRKTMSLLYACIAVLIRCALKIVPHPSHLPLIVCSWRWKFTDLKYGGLGLANLRTSRRTSTNLEQTLSLFRTLSMHSFSQGVDSIHSRAVLAWKSRVLDTWTLTFLFGNVIIWFLLRKKLEKGCPVSTVMSVGVVMQSLHIVLAVALLSRFRYPDLNKFFIQHQEILFSLVRLIMEILSFILNISTPVKEPQAFAIEVVHLTVYGFLFQVTVVSWTVCAIIW